jgi:uncharacterized repeat protein (TIGR01451 family)
MTTSASGRSACRFGAFLSIIILVTMAVLVAAPSTSEAKTQLWLYPDVDDPRAGGHVVTDGMFTLVVENRGKGEDDTASAVSLVVAVNDKTLLGSVTLVWPDVGVTEIVAKDLQPGTPDLLCEGGKDIPRHGVYPADFTTVSFFEADSIAEIGPGEIVEIEVMIVGDDGLEVHFDVIAEGHKMKKGNDVCYGVVNPSGHDVTVILGEAVEAECPAVTIDKSANPTSVEFGEGVEYTIEVENTGDCELTDLVITEDIPTVTDPGTGIPVPAFTVDPPPAVDPTPAIQTDDLITWHLVSLPAGEMATFTLTAVFVEAADGHKVVNTACVTADGIDEQCSKAAVAVGVNANAGDIRGPGFWCNRIRFADEGKRNATYTIDELEAFLELINEGTDTSVGSSVFSDLYEASTLEDARTLLCQPRLARSAADRLARHLLTLWFNIVSERVAPELTTLDELCPGDEELPDDADGEMTVGEVVAGAEDELLLEEPDDVLLDWWKDIIDFINNSNCNEVDEPVSQMRRFQGRRLGRH